VDVSSDEEEPSTSTQRSKHSKATTSSNEGGSERDEEEEPPSYNKAKLAHSKIECILQDLSIDERSNIAESIAQDF
jgi:hypothetical protein